VHIISVGTDNTDLAIIVKYIFLSLKRNYFYFIHSIDIFFKFIWKSKCITCSLLFSKLFQTRFLFKLNNNYCLVIIRLIIIIYIIFYCSLILLVVLIMFYHFRFKTPKLCLIFSLTCKSKCFTFYEPTDS